MSNFPDFFNSKAILFFLIITISTFFSIYIFEVLKLFIIAFIIVYITNPIKVIL
jgi:predicted PurR-regulated permease PerM